MIRWSKRKRWKESVKVGRIRLKKISSKNGKKEKYRKKWKGLENREKKEKIERDDRRNVKKEIKN
jgi:hypothetical protein